MFCSLSIFVCSTCAMIRFLCIISANGHRSRKNPHTHVPDVSEIWICFFQSLQKVEQKFAIKRFVLSISLIKWLTKYTKTSNTSRWAESWRQPFRWFVQLVFPGAIPCRFLLKTWDIYVRQESQTKIGLRCCDRLLDVTRNVDSLRIVCHGVVFWPSFFFQSVTIWSLLRVLHIHTYYWFRLRDKMLEREKTSQNEVKALVRFIQPYIFLLRLREHLGIFDLSTQDFTWELRWWLEERKKERKKVW